MSKPFISIITPVKNGEKSLQRTINSISQQTFKNFEYIIIDGNSNDNTKKIVENNREFIKTYVREKDEGIYDAMNKGINLAKGSYVSIINSDDYLNPGALEKIYLESLKTKKSVIFYSDMNVFFKRDQVLLKGEISEKSIFDSTLSINHPTIFVPRIIYKKYGLFKKEFKYSADRELILRFINKKVDFKKINIPLASFSLGGTTSTYSFKYVKEESISEYRLLKIYTNKKIALKRSFNTFLRLFRNLILSYILPRDIFLKLRLIKIK